MTILSDYDISRCVEFGGLRISPFHPDRLQPASYDLALANQFKWIDRSRCPKEWLSHYMPGIRPGDLALDPYDESWQTAYKTHMVGPRSQFVIEPNMFVLGSTQEWIEIPTNVVARLEGKSSLARLGLAIHSTAGFVDPGFRGNLTLEIYNFSNIPVSLRPGMVVAQVSFMFTNSPAQRPYGDRSLNSKYQDSRGTIESRYAQNPPSQA